MAFLKYMDSMSIAMAFVLLILMFNRISRPGKMQHSLWFAGAVALATVVLLGTRDVALAVNSHYTAMALMAVVLMASGFTAVADKEGKWSPYFSLTLVLAALVYALISHYRESVTGQVLADPVFLVVAGIALLILVLVPAWLFFTGKANYHALAISVGWILVTVASWYQWSAATERIVMEADALSSTVFTILFIGMVSIIAGFSLTGWLDDDKQSVSG